MIDRDWLAELRRHLDERHQHLCHRLDDLEASLRTMCAELSGRICDHEAYHRANEHSWGLARLARRNPWRLAALAFLLGGAACALYPETPAGLAEGIRWLIRILR